MLNPVWHGITKQEKCSTLELPRGNFCKTQWAGQGGCQNNPIDLNFHLQKSLEILEKKSADKIWSNKFNRIKMPCPVPDRVKFK